MKNSSLAWIIGAVVVLTIILIAWHPKPNGDIEQTDMVESPLASVVYSCDAGKTIMSKVGTDSTTITLSDDRTYTLAQAVSASGVRYTNTDATVEFWVKGDNAFLSENGTTTYANCVAGSSTPTSGSAAVTFMDQGHTFSFQHAKDIAVSGGGIGYTTEWTHDNAGNTNGLILAQATVDRGTQPGTNFSDAKFTVGTSSEQAAVKNCLISSNGNNPQKSTLTINGVTYAKIIDGDAAAGNFYETTSYRTVRNNQCYSIEYVIHSTNIGNYDPNQGITEFNKEAVTAPLEQMVRSFKFL